jgi:hypothetical protein
LNLETELSRTLTDVLATGRAANIAMSEAAAELERRKARIDQLEFLLHRFVLAHETTEADSEGHYPRPDTGCIECTLGTVPDIRNTGRCAYHETRRVLGIKP